MLFPESFLLSWNVGHAGFAFAPAFILAEIVGTQFSRFSCEGFTHNALSGLIISYSHSSTFGFEPTDCLSSDTHIKLQ